MANLKNKRFLEKWQKVVGDTIERMGENTMTELWAEFDKIKIDMKTDADKQGINLEEV